MTVALVVVALWAVATTCLYAGEYLRRQRAEREIEVMGVRLETVTMVANEHDGFLRGLIERAYNGTDAELANKQSIIEKLVTPQAGEVEVNPHGLDDARLDVEPTNTRDWTDGDPMLWPAAQPGGVGMPLPGTVPDIEEM